MGTHFRVRVRRLFLQFFGQVTYTLDKSPTQYTSKRMAGAAGLEPVTSAVTGQRSNQLSYAPAMGPKR